jgi:hypothetical protein
MWKRHFRFTSDAQPGTVLETVSSLLSKRSVQHSIGANNITSTRVPLPIVGWDKRLYSRDNFVGVNPFVFIDRIELNVERQSAGETIVDVLLVQWRSFVPLAFLLIMSFGVWLSEDSLAMKAVSLLAALGWYVFAFHLVIGNLLLDEIKKAL